MKTLNDIRFGILPRLTECLILLLVFIVFSFASRRSSIPVHPVGKAARNISQPEKVRRIYTSQIGIREEGHNTGKAVEAYLTYVGLPKGNPWCAAFVCWVFGQAGIENPRTGWSPALFKSNRVIWERAKSISRLRTNSDRSNYQLQIARSRSKLTSRNSPVSPKASAQEGPARPQSGDVFGIYFPEQARIAHVGFIDQWDGNWLITVEGNTNYSGSREGDGVYRKRRLLSSIYKVARYISLNGKEGS